MVNFTPKTSSVKFTPKQAEQSQGADNSGLYTTAALAAGAGAAIGTGAAIKNVLFRPARNIKELDSQLNSIKNKFLNEPNIANVDIPSAIKERGQINNQKMNIGLKDTKSKIATIKASQMSTANQIKKSLENFDKNVLSQSIDEMTTSFKTEIPKFFNETYKNYGKALDAIEGKIEASGKPLNGNNFIKDVVQKTIEDSIAAGVPEEKLQKLLQFNDQFQFGSEAPFKSLKNSVNILSNDVPKETLFKLKHNWGQYLEANAPEASSDLSVINKDYSEVAKLRNALYKTVDPQTGEFDRSKLNKMFRNYARSKVKTGLEEQLAFISKGTSVSPSLSTLEKPFQQLSKAKNIGSAITTKAEKTILRKSSEVRKLQKEAQLTEQAIENNKLNTMQWAEKANKLLSEQDAIASRHPIRSGGGAVKIIGRLTGSVAKRVARGAGVFSIVPTITSFFGNDGKFDKARGLGLMLGIDVPERGTIDREVIENVVNGVPMTQKISDKKRFEILVKYGLGA